MTLSDYGAIAAIIVCVIAVVGVIWASVRGGFGLLGKIGKIDQIERGVNALLLIHAHDLITLYKDKIRLVFNPIPSPCPYPDKDELLAKLERGHLSRSEAARLTQILKEEEAEAKRKDQQVAVLAIGALLLLVMLLSKKE